MVDLDCTTKMVQSPPTLSKKPSKISRNMSTPILTPVQHQTGELSPASDPSCTSYEAYLNLPELHLLWSSIDFPGWDTESIIKPALQALEITFRFISLVLSDSRPHLNRREWDRKLDSLTRHQVEIISALCEDDETRGAAPIVDLTSSFGEVISHTGSSAEVWKLAKDGAHDTTVVCRSSVFSLLPRLATWRKSEEIATRIGYAIESGFRRCGYTLGLGEPNLEGKPSLNYDAVCRPSELHALKKSALDVKNPENEILLTIHQIFESWVFSSKKILQRINERILKEEYSKATDDCWVLEKIWNLLEEIENLHLLMDPDDFLQLKTQLKMKTTSDKELFCFRSKGLVEVTRLSKDLRHKVPGILGVKVDPMGGPVIQESAMELYREKRVFEKIHLLQAFQGVESSLKRFFFSYKQVLVNMMGSLEAKGNFGFVSGSGFESESSEMLAQIFLVPTYYPSLDGAKTFIGDFWEHHDRTAVNGCDDHYHRNGRIRRADSMR